MNAQQQRVLDRDGHKCRLCPSEKFLQVHHFNDIVPGTGWVSAYETHADKDMVTLCRKCHGVFNRRGRSRKRWEYRRRLTLSMYGVDIGTCEVHRWVHENGITHCAFCPAVR